MAVSGLSKSALVIPLSPSTRIWSALLIPRARRRLAKLCPSRRLTRKEGSPSRHNTACCPLGVEHDPTISKSSLISTRPPLSLPGGRGNKDQLPCSQHAIRVLLALSRPTPMIWPAELIPAAALVEQPGSGPRNVNSP